MAEVIKIKRRKEDAWSRFELDMELEDNFYEFQRKMCEEIVHIFENKELIKSFQDSKFDLL